MSYMETYGEASKLEREMAKKYNYDYAAMYAYVCNFLADIDGCSSQDAEISDVYCMILSDLKQLITSQFMNENGYELVGNTYLLEEERWIKRDSQISKS